MEKRIYLKSPRKDLDGLELTCTVKDADDRGMANRPGRSIHPIDGRDDLLVKFIPLAEREKIEKLIEIGLRIENEEKNSVLTKAFPLANAYNSEDNAEGTWCGFVMENCKDDCSLRMCLIPAQCKELLGEERRYIRMLGICCRLCWCFELLHKNGLMVSDIKPDNFFLTKELEIYPIDLDGFSVDGRCSQPPLPDYFVRGETPQSPFVPTMTTEDHGLAMLLFQLLTSTEILSLQLDIIRSYDLKEMGSDYDMFKGPDWRDCQDVMKRRFYPAWYILSEDIRKVFLSRLFETDAVMPNPLEWIALAQQFVCVHKANIQNAGFPPRKKIRRAIATSHGVPAALRTSVTNPSSPIGSKIPTNRGEHLRPHNIAEPRSTVGSLETINIMRKTQTVSGQASTISETNRADPEEDHQDMVETAPTILETTFPSSNLPDYELSISEEGKESPSIPEDTDSEYSSESGPKGIWPYMLGSLLVAATAILVFVLWITTR